MQFIGMHMQATLRFLAASPARTAPRLRSATAPHRRLCLLLMLLALPAAATNHILRQDEIMAGFNGDPRVQFIEITVGGSDQKAWGPQPGENASRGMLVCFDDNGLETGTFFFPSNAPIGVSTVLIATTNFAALPGAPIPDFII